MKIIINTVLILGIMLSSSLSFGRNYPVDLKVSPCDDFYQYVCNRVINNFTLPKNRNRYVFAFSDLNEQMLSVKKKYLHKLAKRHPNNEIENDLKNYYLAEINRHARKQEEKQIILETKQKLAGIKTKKEFLQIASQNILQVKEFSFLSLQLNLTNQTNNSYNDITFNIPLLSLPENSYYQNKKLINEYFNLITYFFKILGSKNPSKQAKIIIDFEQALAKKYPTPQIIKVRYNQSSFLTRKQLINLKNFHLNKILERIPTQTVIRDLIGYDTLDWLDNHLAELTLDKLKTLALFYQLFPIIDSTNSSFYQKKFTFIHNYLGGPPKRPNLQERATTKIMNNFAMEIDHELLPVIFPNFPKLKIQALVTKVQNNLLEQLEQNNWLSKQAKQAAINKIKKLKWYLVSPNNAKEWNFNPKVKYHCQQPIHNQWKLEQAIFDSDLNQLNNKIDNCRWWIGPLSINAYYEPSFNRIVVPVGILQPPFYDPNLPEIINLGAIGIILGHEMGHAIDDQGSCYNEQGLLKPWMSKADQQEFKRKTAKLITLFDQIGHNGKYTLGENIGDLVGITTAYLTMKKLNPTLEESQEFFKKYACLWCEIERPASRIRRLKTDVHALGKARVNQQLKLQPGFKEAFNCKNTDKMVCKEVIKVW